MTRFKRFAQRRGSGAGRPSRTWAGIAEQFAFSAITATTATALVQLQAPTSLASLTSDPPEDMTVLRVVGSFGVTVSTIGTWTLGLTVQDTAWTPSTISRDDADKRILWSRTFAIGLAVPVTWATPGYMLYDTAGTVQVAGIPGCCDIDVKPLARIEPGKALYLVAWEDGGASTLTVAAVNMRLLYQRSPRRS